MVRDWKNCWLEIFNVWGKVTAKPWLSSALPFTPQPQSQCPSLAVAANPQHTMGSAPHLPLEPLTQLLSGQTT